MDMAREKFEDELMHATRRWNGLALEPANRNPVRVLNAGLNDRGNEIVAQGFLDIDSLGVLRVDSYQREVLSPITTQRRSALERALEEGAQLPTIILGMRGEHISFPKGENTCTLLDPVYIIDGLQRVFAMKRYAEVHPEEAKNLRIGAEVRFGTTRDSEKDLFNVLNTARIPVSPNVILRNAREDHPSVLTLYGLCTADKDFALYQRVCWNQRMTRDELISAMTLTRVARILHSGGRAVGSGRVGEMVARVDVIADNFKLANFRANVAEFFEVIDICYGLRDIQMTQKITQLRGNFLATVASVIGGHEEFWKGKKLFLDAPTKRKLAQFPINDPEIMRLASAGNSAMPILKSYMVDHLNKGRKASNRLKPREED